MTYQKKESIKLTSRGRYAVMAMVNLAQSYEDHPTPLIDIAQKSDISLSYLEQLVAGLRRHQLVKSYRGPGGGYILNKAINDIFISEILIAAEDSIPARKKKTKDAAAAKLECEHTSKLWGHIGDILDTHLRGVTLHDIIHSELSVSAA